MRYLIAGLLLTAVTPATASAQAPFTISPQELMEAAAKDWYEQLPEPDSKTAGQKNLEHAQANASKSTADAAEEKGASNAAKDLVDAGKQAQNIADIAKSAQDLLDAYEALTDEDKAASPDYNPPGMPQVPLRCFESAGCRECFSGAQESLRQVRARFERLRAVYIRTKTFTDRSIAFGDNVSGVHGIAGLAWHAERVKILGSMQGFNQSYDNKYSELVGVLGDALQQIGQCEARHFDEPDWYDRFGFIYYSFMVDRYKR